MPTSSSIIWASLAMVAGQAAYAASASIRVGQAHAAAPGKTSQTTGMFGSRRLSLLYSLLYSFSVLVVVMAHVVYATWTSMLLGHKSTLCTYHHLLSPPAHRTFWSKYSPYRSRSLPHTHPLHSSLLHDIDTWRPNRSYLP